MLDDFKADKTHGMIKRRSMDIEFEENGCPEPAFKQKTNDNEILAK